MQLTQKQLFIHELCSDFTNEYDMPKDESKMFHEAFAHFHHAMCDVNGQWLRNQIFLDENFFELWNDNDPNGMFRTVIAEAVKMLAQKAIE